MTPPAAHLSTVSATSGVATGDSGARVKVVIDVFDRWHDKADTLVSPTTICWVAADTGVRPA